jgi:hypothetical protein
MTKRTHKIEKNLNALSTGCSPCLNETIIMNRKIGDRKISELKISEIKKIVSEIFKNKN